jgi:translocation and assembly module TamB
MNAAGAKPRRRRLWVYLLASALSILVLLAGLGWYITTPSFQAMVRRRLVAELQRVTGGRVELGSFHTTPLRLRVEVRDLTIHGREAAGEIPYAHVDRVVADVKIISVLGFEFGFSSLVLDRPVIHLIVYPDGSTNQPTPKVQPASQGAIQKLFALSIRRLEVRRGEFIWNNQSMPLDFVANDISADMTYSLFRRRYQTNLLLGKIVTRYNDYRPVAWMAEAHFNLGSDSIEVRSLHARSGHSHFEASGLIENLRQPRFAGAYHGTFDLEEAAGILRVPALRRGTVDVSGHGTWSGQQFSSAGRLLVKDFEWRDKFPNLDTAAVSADFSANNQLLTISHIQGQLLGGAVSGEAEVANWLLPTAQKPTRGSTAREQKGTVALRLKGISAGAVATAVSTPALPLRRMNLAGSANGTLDLRWRGSPANADANAALEVSAPASAAPSQLPLNAHFKGAYYAASGELEVSELNASTPATQLQASGRLGAAGALRLSLSNSNLSEWQPILAAFGKPERIPVILHGHASFNGTASGKIPNLALAGNLQVEDFDYLVPATNRTPQQPVHWDSLAANVQLSRRALAVHGGTLRHGDTDISFNLSASLSRGTFTGQSPFSAQIEMHNANLGEILSLAGYNYPFQGTVNLTLSAAGTRDQPTGGGHLQLTNGRFYGQAVQSLVCDLHFGAGEAQCDHLELAYGSALVSGNAAYNLSTQAFAFDLTGTNFNLASLPIRQSSRFQAGGRMDFTAQGSGTPNQPSINAVFHLSGLSFDHQPAGNFTLQASTKGADLVFTGRSQFPNSTLNLDGTVHLRGDWPGTVKVHFDHLAGDRVLRAYLHGPISSHSVASGDLQVEGPFRHPYDLTVAGTLTDLQVGVENVQLHNDGAVRFSVSRQLFRLEPFRLVGEGTDLSGHGTVQMNGEHQLDLAAQGHFNLKLIETFNSDFTSSGALALDMTVTGTTARPVTQGKLQITNAGIAYIDLPSALSGINGSVVFSQNHLQIEDLTARTGGGNVSFTGDATWYNRLLNFNLDLRAQEVRLRYPPGVSSTANAHLRFAGSSNASALTGDVTITKLAVMPGFDFGAYLARTSRTVTLPQTNPLLNRIRLDVHIVTTPELQMQTAAVRLSGDADLRLRGTAAKPVVLGRADVLEGQVYFNGTKYELQRGDVIFTNPVTTTPLLDLQASTQVRDYDVTINVNGPPDKLKLTYRSEPPLPEADIITLLALGQTTQESAQLEQTGQNAFAQEASSAIIAEALNATVSNRVQRLFGVSRIKINPQGISTETNPARGPQVTIEQQVGNNLTLSYTTSVSQASQQIIQGEYDITHNISIIGERDQNGVVSFDIRIRQRKK